jgi:hypothetical protein
MSGYKAEALEVTYPVAVQQCSKKNGRLCFKQELLDRHLSGLPLSRTTWTSTMGFDGRHLVVWGENDQGISFAFSPTNLQEAWREDDFLADARCCFGALIFSLCKPQIPWM